MRINNKIVIVLLMLVVGICEGGFSLYAKPKKQLKQPNVEQLLQEVRESSPSQWPQGMSFVYLNERIDMTLSPEIPMEEYDTIMQKGSIWHYDSMVSEEDWMGQELLQLRFISPQGRAYRYSTGRPMTVVSDTTYHPILSCMYPQELIKKTDDIFRARTLYILINDDRLVYPADTVSDQRHEKFVPVKIDSVCFGTEIAPIRFCFHNGEEAGWADTVLPSKRELTAAMPISRFFSTEDPYVQHPDITPEIWSKIRMSQVQLDMTTEEVRLSWGRPSKVDKGASRSGMVEYWYYSNNRILQFWDGRLSKMGIL